MAKVGPETGGSSELVLGIQDQKTLARFEVLLAMATSRDNYVLDSEGIDAIEVEARELIAPIAEELQQLGAELRVGEDNTGYLTEYFWYLDFPAINVKEVNGLLKGEEIKFSGPNKHSSKEGTKVYTLYR